MESEWFVESFLMIIMSGASSYAACAVMHLFGLPGRDIVWDRLFNFVENWKTQPARSFMEVCNWVVVQHLLLKHHSAFTSIVLSAFIGGLACIMATILQPTIMKLVRKLTPNKIRLKVPKDLKPRPGSTILVIVWPLLYFEYKLFMNGGQAAATIAFCGVAFLLIGDTLMKFESLNKIGSLLLDRAFNITRNWKNHPIRSAFELTTWVGAISFALSQDYEPVAVINLATVSAISLILCNHLAIDFNNQQKILTVEGVGTVVKDPRNRIMRTTVVGDPKIGVDGKWYDVSKFVEYHPGGDVLKEFYEKDATLQFYAFHDPKVIKRFSPVGTCDETISDPLECEFISLVKEFREQGLFDPPVMWYAGKVIFNISLIVIAYVSLRLGSTMLTNTLLPGVSLGLFWQQSGFLAHDFMHSSVFGVRKRDHQHGWFWGNVCLGLSGIWWKEEHYEHHIFTNTVIPGVSCSDPQQYEQGAFIQDEKLREFLPHAICKYVVAAQRYTFLPIMFFVGRIGICVASYTMQHGWYEWLGVLIHWIGIYVILDVPDLSFSGAFAVWYIASIVQGLLALQLCLSHYDKPFASKEEIKNQWMRRQALSIKDITNPTWLDWIHGGLNLHIAHHVMPRLPRASFRQATVRIYKTLEKHGIIPESQHFFPATSSILNHLGKEAEYYH
eukprot:TRINITY_DN17938_c0_g2_i1.p1 TRINITY_DN17938_c0_g2~~TRINITY_DN17938_c0_g2_i1.p1  ORF type:complete len:670 (+),score=91.20 TRINITY_DN17938_c0_g2_i1:43-2052(+)